MEISSMMSRIALLAAGLLSAATLASSTGPLASARPALALGGEHLYAITTTYTYALDTPGVVGVFVDDVAGSAEGAATITYLDFTLPSGVILYPSAGLPPHCTAHAGRTVICQPLAISLSPGRYLRFTVPVIADPNTAPGVYRDGDATVHYTPSRGAPAQLTTTLQATPLGICIPHPDR